MRELFLHPRGNRVVFWQPCGNCEVFDWQKKKPL